MFCPKCATQNMDNAHFCRACGLDISLVPGALARVVHQAPVVADDVEAEETKSRRRRRKKPATYEKAFENLGVGIAFLIISVAVALFVPSGRFWWFWMLIPGFACLGEGIGQLIRLRRELPPDSTLLTPAELSSPRTAGDLPPRSTSEIMAPPPSVTEGTTRHLGAEAPNKNA
ncbi:MAG TPA: zinc-ribbon domain-containing protein [Pyrinomonadaceae bacterium]|jgi:hypothetical protein